MFPLSERNQAHCDYETICERPVHLVQANRLCSCERPRLGAVLYMLSNTIGRKLNPNHAHTQEGVREADDEKSGGESVQLQFNVTELS